MVPLLYEDANTEFSCDNVHAVSRGQNTDHCFPCKAAVRAQWAKKKAPGLKREGLSVLQPASAATFDGAGGISESYH